MATFNFAACSGKSNRDEFPVDYQGQWELAVHLAGASFDKLDVDCAMLFALLVYLLHAACL